MLICRVVDRVEYSKLYRSIPRFHVIIYGYLLLIGRKFKGRLIFIVIPQQPLPFRPQEEYWCVFFNTSYLCYDIMVILL